MNFIEIKDSFFENEFLEILFASFPELSQTLNKDEGPFIITGIFGSLFFENFQNDDIYSRGIEFINHSLDKGGHETENLITIEVFEEAYTNTLLVEKMKNNLFGKALSIFLKYLPLV
ncbi:MAG: hypothetical protein ACI85O_000190 [Saprospiraceae bacterium]|jgi:hypothetical protein